MPVDEIAEGAIRVFARLVVEIVVEVLFEGGCYCAGFLTLRLWSLGSYPPSPPTPRQETLCKLLGLAELIVVLVALVSWLA